MIEKTGGRLRGAALAEPIPQAPHAALLVDFDNVTMGIRSDLQTQLRKLLNSDIIRGKVSVQRAYADWRRYPQYIVPLTEASIDLIFAPAVGANKKNATDIRLAIDALELVFTRPEIGTYILLSGDSDFSALVLKLKEYGKFVIGVGIRESSSDLLVQNCDEYYSYNELTGLARTGEVEIVRHDPWELVVEAVHKMSQSGDVMRSDRLKQVMQSIDPNFDEKQVGCNRFSKFVLEAGQRGLLRLTRMDNGQYAVDVGPNANITVLSKTAADVPKPPPTETHAAGSKHTTATRGDRDHKTRTLTLAEGLELLKRALVASGAFGKESVGADAARKRMIEIHRNDADPIFEPKRFLKLLRQAHDADVIELIKNNGDDYLLKLSAAVAADMEKAKTASASEEAQAVKEQQQPEEQPEDAAAAEKPKRATKRKTTKKKSTRSRTRAAAKEAAEGDEKTEAEQPAGVEEAEEAVAIEAGDKAKEPKKKATRRKTTEKATATTRTRKKQQPEESKGTKKAESLEPSGSSKEAKAATKVVNPRFRKGSRSVAPKPPQKETESAKETQVSEPEPPVMRVSTGQRTLGIRSGSRGARRSQAAATKEQSPEPPEPTQPASPASVDVALPAASTTTGSDSKSETHKRPAADAPKPEPLDAASRSREAEEDDASGLFRRVAAAFQRAMGTRRDEEE